MEAYPRYQYCLVRDDADAQSQPDLTQFGTHETHSLQQPLTKVIQPSRLAKQLSVPTVTPAANVGVASTNYAFPYTMAWFFQAPSG